MDIAHGKYWDETANAVIGCTRCSAACEHCWAIGYVNRFQKNHGWGNLVERRNERLDWTGDIHFRGSVLTDVLKRRVPTVYAWNFFGDTYHEGILDAYLEKMFAVMMLTPRHTHLILTKRGDRMRRHIRDVTTYDTVARWARVMQTTHHLKPGPGMGWPLRNVHLGISAWDDASARAACVTLSELRAMGWKTVLSLEPLIGPPGDLETYLLACGGVIVGWRVWKWSGRPRPPPVSSRLGAVRS